jgi:hypothetical protein
VFCPVLRVVLCRNLADMHFTKVRSYAVMLVHCVVGGSSGGGGKGGVLLVEVVPLKRLSVFCERHKFPGISEIFKDFKDSQGFS